MPADPGLIGLPRDTAQQRLEQATPGKGFRESSTLPCLGSLWGMGRKSLDAAMSSVVQLQVFILRVVS